MRYIPQQRYGGNTSRAFDPGARPDLDKMPKDLADLIREADEIRERTNEARSRVQEIAGDHHDEAAQKADEASAAAAARVGEPIPPAEVLAKLLQDREEAVRVLTAQETALREVIDECSDVANRVWFDTEAERVAERAKRRAAIEKAAQKLADQVEAAVDEGAAADWLRTAVYYRPAQVYAVDAMPDLARHGLDRTNCGWFPVRQVILGAALAVMDDE